MPDNNLGPAHVPAESHERLAREVMRRQARLSICIALVFLVILFGLPLINLYYPEIANRSVFGFTASWLFLGVLFYPITWFLSWYFIRASDRIEAQCADWRAVLGEEAGEPLEPEGIDEVHPAFIKSDAQPPASKPQPSEEESE